MKDATEICPDCGVRQKGPESPGSGSWDQLAAAGSWLAVVVSVVLAVGTITESVPGMPVRMWASTGIYLLIGLFAAPPFRRWLEEALDVEFERGVVAVAILIAWFVNEGLIAPPITSGF